jgi:hypothetical protein
MNVSRIHVCIGPIRSGTGRTASGLHPSRRARSGVAGEFTTSPVELVARRALGASLDMPLKVNAAEDLLAFRTLWCGPRLIPLAVIILADRRRGRRCMDVARIHVCIGLICRQLRSGTGRIASGLQPSRRARSGVAGELTTLEELIARRALGATLYMPLKDIVAEDLLAFRTLSSCGPRLIRVAVISLAARRRSGRCMAVARIHVCIRPICRQLRSGTDRIASGLHPSRRARSGVAGELTTLEEFTARRALGATRDMHLKASFVAEDLLAFRTLL